MSVKILEDEIDKRVRQMHEERRAGTGTSDPTRLERPRKDRRYKWVNKHSERVDHFASAGYQATPRAKEEGTAPVIGVWDEALGAYRRGDTILMETPMDNYVERAAKAKYTAEVREQAGRIQIMEKIDRIARDEGRIRRPVAFDESEQGAERTGRRPRRMADFE